MWEKKGKGKRCRADFRVLQGGDNMSLESVYCPDYSGESPFFV